VRASPLPLTIATGDYDRTRAIADGRVGIDSCSVRHFSVSAEELFIRAFGHAEFDVAELSFSTYLMMHGTGTSPYIAIPAFILRMFRHGAIYVHPESGINRPEDLAGRTVGLPEYQVTATVWVRGLLQHQYGVHPRAIAWRTGGVEHAGRTEKATFQAPNQVDVSAIPANETLSEWLVDRKIDALIAPREPRLYVERHPSIKRLFDDTRSVEKAYYAETGIFPTMHVVGIRRELVEKHPWLAVNVYKAFLEARQTGMRELADETMLRTMLPWIVDARADAVRHMGENFWPYGVDDNKRTLDAFLQYHQEQGLSEKRWSYDEIFVPSTLEQYRT
jgi:4,5-dihydroxyphthalate decarboxylase